MYQNQSTPFPTPDAIRAMLDRNDGEAISSAIASSHPYVAARTLDSLQDEPLWNVLRRARPQDAAAVFSHLPISRQIRLARARNVKEVANLLKDMAPDDRVDVLHGLDKGRREKVLDQLPERDRRVTERLASYPEDTVGAVMVPYFISATDQMTVGQALQQVRGTTPRKESTTTVYVTDAEGRLVGEVALVELITAAANTPINRVMHVGIVSVKVDEPRTVAAAKVKDFDLLAVPVTNGEGKLVGVVTVDDVLDVVEEEVSDTMYQKAGVGDLIHQRDHVFSEKLTTGSIAYPIRVRILYLLVALTGGMLVGGLIDFWEDTLAVVLAAAVFIPVIMDMGGNTGTQSTTIFARGLALGHIDLRRFFPYFIREGSIGLVMGAVLGLIGGTIAYFWQGLPNDVPQLGLAVGLSLFAVITVAAMLGFLLPYIMVKLGLDHAPGADPFITTIKDFTGLALYFALVSWLITIDLNGEEEVEAAASLLDVGRQTLAAMGV
jgi:magnesium transporter